MVVDDDPIFRMLVKRVAEQLGRGAELLLCANLEEASRHCQRADFWIVDINLPDGSGPVWVEHQRSAGFQQPTLFLSHSNWTEPLPGEFQLKPSTLDGLKSIMQGWWSA